MTDPTRLKPDVDLMRLPPQAIEAEQGVLGGLMLDNSAHDYIVGTLCAADFYRADHRLIFETIVRLIENNHHADALTVSEALDRAGKLDDAGGRAYVGSLPSNTPSAANIRSYSRIVRERSVLRNLAATGTAMADAAYNPGSRKASELAEEAEARLFEVRDLGQNSDMEALSASFSAVVERIDTMYARDNKHEPIGISSGLVDLDAQTGGFEPGDLIIVGARPSMGKTALALGIADHTAGKGHNVAFFSLEMSKQQVATRALATKAKISMHQLRTGQFEESRWPDITNARLALNERPLYIDDRPGATVSYIRSRCRRLYRKRGPISLIVVDYLTLMNGQGESRDERVGEIAKGLKEIAKEFNVPVLALAQLNRQVEMRPDKRPMMSDLRESGAIEQAADIIMFIYRDEVYHDDSQYKGTAELIIAKQRNGPTGMTRVAFVGKTMHFENLATDWREYLPPPSEPKPRRYRAGKNELFDVKQRQAGEDK